MRLAADETTIRLDSEVIRLRPTLRAACRLERRYGGFEPLFKAIVDGNVTVMADVVEESADAPCSLPAFLDHLAAPGLLIGLGAIQTPLLAHVLALAGLDPLDATKPAKAASGTKRITFEEHHTKLFKVATGWLGWTPEEAWRSTPAEIVAAYEGRLEMLRAIFGGEGEADATSAPDDTRDESAWSRFKFAALAGGNRAA